MKIVLIDSEKKAVFEYEKKVEIGKEEEEIQKLVGGLDVAAEMELEDGSSVIVYADSDGYFDESLDLFELHGLPMPIAGNALVVWYSSKVKTINKKAFFDFVRTNVSFITRSEMLIKWKTIMEYQAAINNFKKKHKKIGVDSEDISN